MLVVMGHPVPEDEPDLGECPNCCEKLHPVLYCRFTAPGLNPFTGTLDQDPLLPCKFSGLLTDGADGGIPVFLTFCSDGAKANIICGPPLIGPCGGVIIDDNHCWPWIDVTSAGGCRYEVWP